MMGSFVWFCMLLHNFVDIPGVLSWQNERSCTVWTPKLDWGKKSATFDVFFCNLLSSYETRNYFLLVSSKWPSSCNVSCCFCMSSEMFSHPRKLYGLDKKHPENYPCIPMKAPLLYIVVVTVGILRWPLVASEAS